MNTSIQVRMTWLAATFSATSCLLLTLVAAEQSGMLPLKAPVFQASLFQASVSDKLQGIKITPSGPLTMKAGDEQSFTVEAVYSTGTIPIHALCAGPSEVGSFSNELTTCTFKAKKAGQANMTVDAMNLKLKVQITVTAANPFKDELPDWAENQILKLYGLGIIKGYDNGTFGAGDPVTQGQMVTFLYRLLLHKTLVQEPNLAACQLPYEDIPADHYARPAFCSFQEKGMKVPGEKKPTQYNVDLGALRSTAAKYVNWSVGATLLDASKIVVDLSAQVFSDVFLNHPNFADIATVNALEIIKGYPEGTFGPTDGLNRAQAAVILYRIMEKLDQYKVTVLAGAPQVSSASSSSVNAQASSASSACNDVNYYTLSCSQAAVIAAQTVPNSSNTGTYYVYGNICKEKVKKDHLVLCATASPKPDYIDANVGKVMQLPGGVAYEQFISVQGKPQGRIYVYSEVKHLAKSIASTGNCLLIKTEGSVIHYACDNVAATYDAAALLK